MRKRIIRKLERNDGLINICQNTVLTELKCWFTIECLIIVSSKCFYITSYLFDTFGAAQGRRKLRKFFMPKRNDIYGNFLEITLNCAICPYIMQVREAVVVQRVL